MYLHSTIRSRVRWRRCCCWFGLCHFTPSICHSERWILQMLSCWTRFSFCLRGLWFDRCIVDWKTPKIYTCFGRCTVLRQISWWHCCGFTMLHWRRFTNWICCCLQRMHQRIPCKIWMERLLHWCFRFAYLPQWCCNPLFDFFQAHEFV